MIFAVVVMQKSKGIEHHIEDHHRNHWGKFDIMNSTVKAVEEMKAEILDLYL